MDNSQGDILSKNTKNFPTSSSTPPTDESSDVIPNDNVFLILPSELQRRIVYFLNSADAINFTKSNIVLGKVNVSKLHSIPLQSLHMVGLRDNGDIPQPYEPRIKPTCKISNVHSMSVRAQWKDQGWGNMKGMMYIVATPKTTTGKLGDMTTVADSTQDQTTSNNAPFDGGRVIAMTTASAPHDWEQVELTFSPIDGEVYNLWYSIGGGGGHELFLKDVEVQTYIFDDHQFTYQKTFEGLYNIGCVGSTNAQAPIRPNGLPRWTQITATQLSRRTPFYFGIKRPPNNASDLFYPKMLLSVCQSLKRQLMAVNESVEERVNTYSDFLDPLKALLSEYGLPINLDTLSAIEDIIETDIDERNNDWYNYESNCRKLHKRLNLDENATTTNGRPPRMGIPIEIQNATINGFRIVLPRDGRVREGNERNEPNNNVNVENNNEDGENGIRIEPMPPPPNGVDPPVDNDDGAIPQVINNPDGTVSINLGNLENLAANAIPMDFGNVPNNNIDRAMDMEDPPAAADQETDEMFGIARAAMAAVFGFQNVDDANDGANNMNGVPNGFQNFFPQANFVGGRRGNGGMFVGNNNNVFGAAFQFQNIIDLANHQNDAPQREPQAQTDTTTDHNMTDNDDNEDDDDDEVEEIPIL
jgi:hypothetical protein